MYDVAGCEWRRSLHRQFVNTFLLLNELREHICVFYILQLLDAQYQFVCLFFVWYTISTITHICICAGICDIFLLLGIAQSRLLMGIVVACACLSQAQYATRWWTLRPNTFYTQYWYAHSHSHTHTLYKSPIPNHSPDARLARSLHKSTARIKPRTLKWPSHSSAVAFRHHTPTLPLFRQLLPHIEVCFWLVSCRLCVFSGPAWLPFRIRVRQCETKWFARDIVWCWFLAKDPFKRPVHYLWKDYL